MFVVVAVAALMGDTVGPAHAAAASAAEPLITWAASADFTLTRVDQQTAFIRDSGEVDGVFDFDAAVRDPATRPSSCRYTTAATACIPATPGTGRWLRTYRSSCWTADADG